MFEKEFQRLEAIDSFKELTERIIGCEVTIPIPDTQLIFTQDSTSVIFYSSFFGIFEHVITDEESEDSDLKLVALGESFPRGLRLIDYRYMQDMDTFKEGAEAFFDLLTQRAEIEGFAPEVIHVNDKQADGDIIQRINQVYMEASKVTIH